MQPPRSSPTDVKVGHMEEIVALLIDRQRKTDEQINILINHAQARAQPQPSEAPTSAMPDQPPQMPQQPGPVGGGPVGEPVPAAHVGFRAPRSPTPIPIQKRADRSRSREGSPIPTEQPSPIFVPSQDYAPTEIAQDGYEKHSQVKEEIPGPVNLEDPFLSPTQPMYPTQESNLIPGPAAVGSEVPPTQEDTKEETLKRDKPASKAEPGESPPRKDQRAGGG